jgi:hypothetical protein
MEIRFSHTQEPEPPLPEPAQPEPPMIYVYEDLKWEYRRIAWDTRQEGPPPEQELNAHEH